MENEEKLIFELHHLNQLMFEFDAIHTAHKGDFLIFQNFCFSGEQEVGKSKAKTENFRKVKKVLTSFNPRSYLLMIL